MVKIALSPNISRLELKNTLGLSSVDLSHYNNDSRVIITSGNSNPENDRYQLSELGKKWIKGFAKYALSNY